MSHIESREIRLAARLKGTPSAANFTLGRSKLESLPVQEVLLHNLFMSVSPSLHGPMNEGKSSVPPFDLGKPLEGGVIGEVIESRAKEFKPRDRVTSNFGWSEYFMPPAKECHPVHPAVQPLSVYLGAFDHHPRSVVEQLKVEAPDGIEVYCDNVGDESHAAALGAPRLHRRIIACGSISDYNAEKPQPGPANLFNIITKRLTYTAGKPMVAERHAPGIFSHAKSPDGSPLVRGKSVTSFTNTEETAVELTNIVPFLGEEVVKQNGGNLITDQNPDSAEAAAEAALGRLHFESIEGNV